jgi:hypothetical protein
VIVPLTEVPYSVHTSSIYTIPGHPNEVIVPTSDAPIFIHSSKIAPLPTLPLT